MRDGPSTPLLVLTAALLLSILLLAVISVIGADGGAETASATAAEAGEGIAEDLLAELADGGEVLLVRHALTDPSQTDADPTARGGCEQQRNLSAQGRAQAARIGHGMQQRLPVGTVLASPFCRAIDTARAIDPAAEASDALLSLTAVRGPDAVERLTQAGADLIAAELGGDDLAVLVSHTQNIEALTGRLVDEGDAVVLDASGVVDVIAADDW